MYLNFKKILHENPLLLAKELTQKTFNILKEDWQANFVRTNHKKVLET